MGSARAPGGAVRFAVAAAGAVLALMAARRGERARITPMSVKEAVDSLPSGVCVYLPGGRVILINRAMERLGPDYMNASDIIKGLSFE